MIAYYASWSDRGEFCGKGEVWFFEENESEAIEQLANWFVSLNKIYDNPFSYSILDNLWSASSMEELASNKQGSSIEEELKEKVINCYNQKIACIKKREQEKNSVQFEIQKQKDYETYLRLKERFENDLP